jgi:5-methylcytosine-specific restriction endonuclease McrA
MAKKAKKKKVARKKTSTRPWWWKYMISRARQVMKWSPEKRRVIAEAKGFCPSCKKQREYIDADHVSPVVPVDQPFNGDWNTLFDRMFNGLLQALCDECHAKKTQEENKLRAIHRAELKKFVQKEDSSSQEE